MALNPTDIYTLGKTIWTHDDFEAMGWHDVVIHAITFQPEKYEFILDIDYIFAWVNPEPPSPYFSFWISPATLVFENVHNFKAQLEDPIGLQIMGVSRKDAVVPRNADCIKFKTEWTWTLDLLQGDIEFSSVGFSQYIRRNPVRVSSQHFSLEERGGISFDRRGDGL